jgi:hypothetical protein
MTWQDIHAPEELTFLTTIQKFLIVLHVFERIKKEVSLPNVTNHDAEGV